MRTLCTVFLFLSLTAFAQIVKDESKVFDDPTAREEFLHFKRSGGDQLPPFYYSKAVEQKLKMTEDKNSLSKTSTTNWVPLNPGGIYDAGSKTYNSGRTNSIAFHPTDPNILYIGAANGGVWKTIDGGTNWSPLTDGLTTLACGDVIVDQKNPNIIYYGSGELNFSADSEYGDGLFKSTDAGTSWTKVAVVGTTGSYCSQLALDPKNSNILYWAGSAGLLKSTNAGVNWSTINATTNAMNVFPNTCANIGTAVGTNGKIIRTINGGATWTIQTSGTTNTLNGVSFIDANYGMAVGNSGIILKTTNGGTNWTTSIVGTATFAGVSMVDANNATVVGAGGVIYHTTNGGTNWVAQTSGTTNLLMGVSCTSTYGIAVGANGTILRTMNSGAQWTVQTSGTTYGLNGATMIDANTITVVGNTGTILHTTNGGSNWAPQTSGISTNLMAISFYSPTIGVAAGYSGKILRTTNGGTTWTSQTQGSTSYIGVSFTDADRGAVVGTSGTVLRTVDGCTNWTSQTSGITDQLNSVQFVYDNTNILVASFYSGSIRKSTDGGSSWTTLAGGLPATFARAQLAPFRGDFNIIYAGISSASSPGTGLYKTTDMGSNWTFQIASPVNYITTQGHYNNAAVVNPTTSTSLIVGGVNPYSSVNSGVSLTQLSVYDSLHNIHCDIHRVAYRGNTLYFCTDGGVYKSTNDGQTVTDLNRTLSTLQYQSADYAIIDNNKLRGGTQDNSSDHSRNGGTNWDREIGTDGDVGYSFIDQVDTNYTYSCGANHFVGRSSNFGSTWTKITPTASTGGFFYSPFKMALGDHNTLVFGSAQVWKTTSAETCTQSTGWTQIGNLGGTMSAIGISPVNTNKIYIGGNRYVYVTTNNGGSWASQLLTDAIWDLVVDNTNDDICYAALHGGTNLVAKTTNHGTSWTYINGNLPHILVNAIVLRTSPSRVLFVGTDLGVFKSTDEGTTWVSYNSGLPSVPVYDLKYYQSSNKLLAATHGRGCWMFDLSGLGKDMFGEIPKTFNLSQNYPNPFNPESHIQFDIPSAGDVNLTVYDITGREVVTLINNRLNAGRFEVTFDGSKYSSGVYIYKLTLGNSYSATKKMMLLK